MMWKLGDGMDINVGQDNWLGIGSIMSWVQGRLNKLEENLMVTDLFK